MPDIVYVGKNANALKAKFEETINLKNSKNSTVTQFSHSISKEIPTGINYNTFYITDNTDAFNTLISKGAFASFVISSEENPEEILLNMNQVVELQEKYQAPLTETTNLLTPNNAFSLSDLRVLSLMHNIQNAFPSKDKYNPLWWGLGNKFYNFWNSPSSWLFGYPLATIPYFLFTGTCLTLSLFAALPNLFFTRDGAKSVFGNLPALIFWAMANSGIVNFSIYTRSFLDFINPFKLSETIRFLFSDILVLSFLKQFSSRFIGLFISNDTLINKLKKLYNIGFQHETLLPMACLQILFLLATNVFGNFANFQIAKDTASDLNDFEIYGHKPFATIPQNISTYILTLTLGVLLLRSTLGFLSKWKRSQYNYFAQIGKSELLKAFNSEDKQNNKSNISYSTAKIIITFATLTIINGFYSGASGGAAKDSADDFTTNTVFAWITAIFSALGKFSLIMPASWKILFPIVGFIIDTFYDPDNISKLSSINLNTRVVLLLTLALSWNTWIGAVDMVGKYFWSKPTFKYPVGAAGSVPINASDTFTLILLAYNFLSTCCGYSKQPSAEEKFRQEIKSKIEDMHEQVFLKEFSQQKSIDNRTELEEINGRTCSQNYTDLRSNLTLFDRISQKINYNNSTSDIFKEYYSNRDLPKLSPRSVAA